MKALVHSGEEQHMDIYTTFKFDKDQLSTNRLSAFLVYVWDTFGMLAMVKKLDAMNFDV